MVVHSEMLNQCLSTEGNITKVDFVSYYRLAEQVRAIVGMIVDKEEKADEQLSFE